MKKLYLLMFILQITRQSFSMHSEVCDPASFTLILPPATAYHRATGIPTAAWVGQLLSTTPASPIIQDKHLIKTISLIKRERYKDALSELDSFKDFPSKHLPELHALKEELDHADEKLTDQQYEIWENVDAIGCAGCCCLLLNEPLKSVLPLPPDTEWALYSTTACIFYRCCQHANKTCALKFLQKKLDILATIPPMYTIIIPPPQLVMESPQSSKTHAPLERTEKSAYDGCRNRNGHKNR